MTLGSAAGHSGGDFGPALPDAATRTTPFCFAAASARPSAGSEGPAKLILMTRAPCAVAQSIDEMMLIVEPCVALKAQAARMRTAGAAPVRRAWPAMIPAMLVPWLCGPSLELSAS